MVMEKSKILEIDGFSFPWKVSATQGTEEHAHLDQAIRQREEDNFSIQKEKINFSGIEKMFEYTNISLFVHSSQFLSHPVYCILWDITTVKLFTDLKKFIIFISKKFTDSNFQDEDKEKFQKLLYSEENKKRLEVFGLKLYPTEEYRD